MRLDVLPLRLEFGVHGGRAQASQESEILEPVRRVQSTRDELGQAGVALVDPPAQGGMEHSTRFVSDTRGNNNKWVGALQGALACSVFMPSQGHSSITHRRGVTPLVLFWKRSGNSSNMRGNTWVLMSSLWMAATPLMVCDPTMDRLAMRIHFW